MHASAGLGGLAAGNGYATGNGFATAQAGGHVASSGMVGAVRNIRLRKKEEKRLQKIKQKNSVVEHHKMIPVAVW